MWGIPEQEILKIQVKSVISFCKSQKPLFGTVPVPGNPVENPNSFKNSPQ